MKFILLGTILCTAISATSIPNRNSLTRLYKIDSLGQYGRYKHGKILSEQPGQDVKLVMLGQGEKAQEVVRHFLDQKRDVEDIKAIFIAKHKAVPNIVGHWIKNGVAQENAILSLEPANAKRVFAGILGNYGESEHINAVMLVDEKEATEVWKRLPSDVSPDSIKVAFLGRNPKAKDALQQALAQKSNEQQMKIAIIGKNDARMELVDLMFQNVTGPAVVLVGPAAQAEKMAHRMLDSKEAGEVLLIGQHEKADHVVEMLDLKDKDSEVTEVVPIVQGHGQGAKTEKVIVANSSAANVIGDGIAKEGIAKDVIVKNNGANDSLSTNSSTKGSSAKYSPTFESTAFVPMDSPGIKNMAMNNFASAQNPGHRFLSRTLQAPPLKQCPAVVVAEMEEAKAQLADLAATMKRCIRDTSPNIYAFDFRSFEAQGPVLEKRLSAIEAVISKNSCDQHAATGLSFVNEMFATMVRSLEPLKYYSITHEHGRLLVLALIDLNVRVLALTTVHGQADTTIKDYAAKVAGYMQMVKIWSSEFKMYSSVSYGMQSMFRRQLWEADSMLAVMAKHGKPEAVHSGGGKTKAPNPGVSFFKVVIHENAPSGG